jgi:hypothetical protein
VFWTVAFGLAASALHALFNRTAVGEVDNNNNMVFSLSISATLFASAVNVSVGHAFLASKTQDAAFNILGAITGLIALGMASEHNRTKGINGAKFDNLNLAWQSFAVIAGAMSVIVNVLAWRKGAGEEAAPATTSPLITVCRFTVLALSFVLFGTVASLINNAYGQKAADHKNDVFGFSTVPIYAWMITLYASAVAASNMIVNNTGGITNLTITFSALLLGFAAQSVAFGADDNQHLFKNARAWAGIALATAILAILHAHGQVHSKSEAEAAQHAQQQGGAGGDVQLTAGDFTKGDEEHGHAHGAGGHNH